jgi:large subunit ribosomal protein L6
MSRVGNKPIKFAADVKVELKDGVVTVNGKLGTLTLNIPAEVSVVIENNEILVSRGSDKKEHRMIHGTIRSLLNNMVIGVSEGFTKELELVGVGYRVTLEGKNLSLSIGYKHLVKFEIPEYVKVEVPSQTSIKIFGIDKEKVGLFASSVRALKPPEPYKGKGIRYAGEHVRRKEVKTSAS